MATARTTRPDKASPTTAETPHCCSHGFLTTFTLHVSRPIQHCGERYILSTAAAVLHMRLRHTCDAVCLTAHKHRQLIALSACMIPITCIPHYVHTYVHVFYIKNHHRKFNQESREKFAFSFATRNGRDIVIFLLQPKLKISEMRLKNRNLIAVAIKVNGYAGPRISW